MALEFAVNILVVEVVQQRGSISILAQRSRLRQVAGTARGLKALSAAALIVSFWGFEVTRLP